MSEDAAFQKLVQQKDAFMKQNRFSQITRNYSAKEVAELSGSHDSESVYPSAAQAMKLYTLLRKNQAAGTATHTFGALDPIQVVQMAPSLYV